MEKYAEYDSFAWIYNKHWGHMPKSIEPLIEKLFLNRLSQHAAILDLCCGTGQLASMLNQKGYAITGLDGSANMLEIAQQNASDVTFLEADARDFTFEEPFDGVLSTYDSFNHIMSMEDLKRVFHNVKEALVDGGLFMFDVNLESTYTGHWNGSFNIVEDDHVCAVRASSQLDKKKAQMHFTMFWRKEELWERTELTLEQTWYGKEEIIQALKYEGFTNIHTYGSEEFGMKKGRLFVVCEK